jgi:hypothetical protein
MQSEAIGELAAALAKAQAKIEQPTKNRKAGEAGKFGYNYADLPAVIEAYRKPLAENGLALTQTLRVQDGHMILVSTLLHTTGQWLSSEYALLNYSKPQEQGSAISYARRYSASAMLGIAAEDDDDGAAAQKGEPIRRAEPAPQSQDGPLEGDDAAIVYVAAELAQIRGVLDPEDIIKEYSSFKGRDGKMQHFRNPTMVRSEKWKKGVRQRMEADLAKAQAVREPGVDEAVDLFDGVVIER